MNETSATAGIARATAGDGSSPRRPSASSAPTSEPSTPIGDRHRAAPRGAGPTVHGNGIANCDHAHSLAKPTVPISSAGDRGHRQRAADEHQRRPPRRTAPRRRTAAGAACVWPMTGPTSSARPPRIDEEEHDGRERAAAADPQPRARSPTPAASAMQDRLEGHPVLRHAEVELGLEGREADQEAAHEADAAEAVTSVAAGAGRFGQRVAGRGALARTCMPSASSTAWPMRRHAGAADEHQVGRAPERDVLAEEAVPDVVEREAEQREARRAERSGRRRPARTSRGPSRTAAWPGCSPLGIATASTPAAKTPNRPARMK